MWTVCGCGRDEGWVDRPRQGAVLQFTAPCQQREPRAHWLHLPLHSSCPSTPTPTSHSPSPPHPLRPQWHRSIPPTIYLSYSNTQARHHHPPPSRLPISHAPLRRGPGLLLRRLLGRARDPPRQGHVVRPHRQARRHACVFHFTSSHCLKRKHSADSRIITGQQPSAPVRSASA